MQESEILERTPLFRAEWAANLRRLLEHPAAPRWTAQCGDRLEPEDLDDLNRYAARLINPAWDGAERPVPNAEFFAWLEGVAGRSALLQERITECYLETDRRDLDHPEVWNRLQPLERADLRARLHELIPADEDLERLVVNPTSGTTGHPIPAPNHPRSVACYDAIIAAILARCGVRLRRDAQSTAAIQVCAQRDTMTYATVHAWLEGAGFAKINLAEKDWRRPEDREEYVRSLAPQFLSGDPFAFAELQRQGLAAPGGDWAPQALLSTALALTPPLRRELEAYFGCPIADVYSLNETGPLAAAFASNLDARPRPPGLANHAYLFEQVPPDLFLEAADSDGTPVPDGEVGDLLVSGGRNPYLPLLRYRTGDRVRIFRRAGAPPLLELVDVRRSVSFADASGRMVNPVDAARVLRNYPVVQHQLVQRLDHSLRLRLRSLGGVAPLPGESRLRDDFRHIFGELPLEICYDLDPAAGKLAPFVNERELTG